MPLVVEKKIRKDVQKISRQMGIKEKELINRAVLLYLENAKKILDLEREFEAWDILSDEAFRTLSRDPAARL